MALSDGTRRALETYKQLTSNSKTGHKHKSSHPETIWTQDRSKFFKSVREQFEFSDVVVRCKGGHEFPAHWIVLARLGCPYFVNSFIETPQKCALNDDGSQFNDTHEKANEHHRATRIQRHMNWSLIDREIGEIIINFAYTGQIRGITEENLDDFIKAIDYLQAQPLLISLVNYLRSTVNDDNYPRYYEVGRRLYSNELIQSLDDFFVDNFKQLSQGFEQINKLPASDLYRLFTNDRLDVDNELRLVNIIFRWVKHDPTRRRSHVPKLMSTIRCIGSKMPSKSQLRQYMYFKNQMGTREDEELLKLIINEYERSLESLLNCLESHHDEFGNPILGFDDSYEMNTQTCCTRLRNRVQRNLVIIFGGWTPSGCTAGCEAYDFRLDQWRPINCFRGDAYIQSAYHGTVCIDGVVYMIGGYDGVSHFNCVRNFDPKTMTWSWRAPMSRARCYVSVAVLDGQIYAMGGFDGYTRLSSCERYDPELNQWEPIADMNLVRSDGAAATLNGKIYIVGGFTGDIILPSCECYDPDTNTWTLVEPMNGPRSGCQLVSYRGALWALGGNDGLQHVRLKTVERYDPEEGEWELKPSMNNDRSNFSAIVLRDRIYVIGGFSSGRTTRGVEYYDEESEKWSYAGELCNCRSAHSAAIVNGVHFAQNMKNRDLPIEF